MTSMASMASAIAFLASAARARTPPSLRAHHLSTAAWKRDRDSDHFANAAVGENLRSRAAYKLAAINAAHAYFLRQGARVVDLGSAPGGWALIAADCVRLDETNDAWSAASAARLALPERVDIVRTAGGGQRRRKYGEEMEPVAGARFIHGDFNDARVQGEIRRNLRGREADVVLSDMAPTTTGDPGLNHDRIMDLAEGAADVARGLLRNGGVFVCKIFNGAGEREFRDALKNDFLKVKAVKPPASKKASREMFYVASGFVPVHLREREGGGGRGVDMIQDGDCIVRDLEALERRKEEKRRARKKNVAR